MIHHAIQFLWHARGIISNHKAHNDHHLALSLTAAVIQTAAANKEQPAFIFSPQWFALSSQRHHTSQQPSLTGEQVSLLPRAAFPLSGTAVKCPKAVGLCPQPAAHPYKQRAAPLD